MLETTQQTVATATGSINDSLKQDLEHMRQDLRTLLATRDGPSDRGRFLEQLHFPAMDRRSEMIRRGTNHLAVNWVKDLDNDTAKGKAARILQQWPATDKPLLYISGKAGCGKSTLMHHLANSKVIAEPLQRWADGCKLVVAQYYYWQEGEHLEKSMEGFYRTILYQAFQQSPDLLGSVVQKVDVDPGLEDGTFNAFTGLRRFASLSLEFLESAFDRLLQDGTREHRLVLFVDGLDESIDELHAKRPWDHYRHLGRKMKAWSENPGVKILTSSRPNDEFSNSFQGDPAIHLHEVNHADIKAFSAATLHQKVDEPHEWTELMSDGRDGIPQKVSDRSAGVFLWARFATLQLIDAMNLRYTAKEVLDLLDKAPSSVIELYERMLKSPRPELPGDIPATYILGLVAFAPTEIRVVEPINITWLKDTLESSTYPVQCSVAPLLENSDDYQNAVGLRVRKLSSGLVEYGGPRFGLQFIHRTVREFALERLSGGLDKRFDEAFYARLWLANALATRRWPRDLPVRTIWMVYKTKRFDILDASRKAAATVSQWYDYEAYYEYQGMTSHQSRASNSFIHYAAHRGLADWLLPIFTTDPMLLAPSEDAAQSVLHSAIRGALDRRTWSRAAETRIDFESHMTQLIKGLFALGVNPNNLLSLECGFFSWGASSSPDHRHLETVSAWHFLCMTILKIWGALESKPHYDWYDDEGKFLAGIIQLFLAAGAQNDFQIVFGAAYETWPVGPLFTKSFEAFLLETQFPDLREPLSSANATNTTAEIHFPKITCDTCSDRFWGKNRRRGSLKLENAGPNPGARVFACLWPDKAIIYETFRLPGIE
jgi:hypothetical protein